MSNFMNSELFQPTADVSIGRSTFSGLSHSHKTDLTQGYLAPILCEEILPGDTFQVKTSSLIRMATPVFPVMDNAVLDIWYFYCPTRLVFDKAREFYGENTSDEWVQTTEYSIPQIRFRKNVVTSGNGYGRLVRGSLMNRLGVPTTLCPGTTSANSDTGFYLSVSDIPNRMYRLIWNEFFRDQNVDSPVAVYKDTLDRDYSLGSYAYPTDIGYGDGLLQVNRLHDYFTNCLPGPQKSLQPVPASLLVDHVPVVALPSSIEPYQDFTSLSDVSQLHLAYQNAGVWNHNTIGNTFELYMNSSSGLARDSNASTGLTSPLTPDNLFMKNVPGAFATVTTLRQAFAVQRVLELQARAGSRYREQLRAFFGVTSPDLSVQVPEYLGGTRVPINIDQIIQTSATDAVSPQGNVAGYSLTTDIDDSFIKSFVEPGYLIGLAAVRVQHTYSGAMRPFWFRKRRYQFYYPQFANLSEMPVYKKYLNATGIDAVDDEVFGYQAAWEDYRTCPNQLSGVYSPISEITGYTVDDHIVESPSPIASAWTFADWYEMYYDLAMSDEHVLHPAAIESVHLSSSWMKEPWKNVRQVIAVQDEPQFYADFYFDIKATRPMPVTSIPGLIDHH